MNKLHLVTYSLMVFGALNWGLVGAFDIDLVVTLLGSWPFVVTLTYILVGLSAVYELVTHRNLCKECDKI